jgi:hypothetical protein
MAQFVYYRFNKVTVLSASARSYSITSRRRSGNIVYLGLFLISAGVFLFGLRRKIWFNRVSTYPIPPASLPSKTLSKALNIDASGSFGGFCVYWVIPESVTLTLSF